MNNKQAKRIEYADEEVENTVAIFQRMDLEPWEQPPLILRTPSDEELAAHQDLVEWDGSSEDPTYNSPPYDLIIFNIISFKFILPGLLLYATLRLLKSLHFGIIRQLLGFSRFNCVSIKESMDGFLATEAAARRAYLAKKFCKLMALFLWPTI